MIDLDALDQPPTRLLQPLRLRTAGEQIAERLVTAIALGEYGPGSGCPPSATSRPSSV